MKQTDPKQCMVEGSTGVKHLSAMESTGSCDIRNQIDIRNLHHLSVH